MRAPSSVSASERKSGNDDPSGNCGVEPFRSASRIARAEFDRRVGGRRKGAIGGEAASANRCAGPRAAAAADDSRIAASAATAGRRAAAPAERREVCESGAAAERDGFEPASALAHGSEPRSGPDWIAATSRPDVLVRDSCQVDRGRGPTLWRRSGADRAVALPLRDLTPQVRDGEAAAPRRPPIVGSRRLSTSAKTSRRLDLPRHVTRPEINALDERPARPDFMQHVHIQHDARARGAEDDR